MSKQNEAIKFIDIYNQSSDSLEFTKAVYVLKTSDPALYDAVINEIKRNEEIKKQEEPQKTNINTSSNIVEIDYASNASSAAIEAYQNAMLADGGQTTNQITIKATEKPTVDIPITIVIRNDL